MNAMDQSIRVDFELEGWALLFALVARIDSVEGGLAKTRAAAVARARQRFVDSPLTRDPKVAALRRLFRAAGCDPTRYRPSSEALLRRVLKGAELPAISPLVDLNNCLSLELAVPCCVMAAEKVDPPFVLRAGRPGETYESLKGPFNLAGKPLLVDRNGPCDAPITGSERVKIDQSTRRAWLVAYLPAEAIEPAVALQALERLLAEAPEILLSGSSGCPAQAE